MVARAGRHLVTLCFCYAHVASSFSLSPGRAWGFAASTAGTTTHHQQLWYLQQQDGTPFDRLPSRLTTRRPHKRLCLKAEVLEGATVAGSGTSTSGGGGRREDAFERWATQAGIKAPKLRHEVFEDKLVGDLRGLKAVEATSKSEQLVTVPAKAAITLMASESTPFKSWISSEFWDSQQWYVKLALKLLWERQLGGASAVEGYIDVLPAQGSFDTLIHWSDEELDMLNYPKCVASAKRQRAAWDKLHQDLVANCPEGAGRAVTRDELVWAMECVLSRAFNGRFGGGQNSVYVSGGLVVAACAAYAFTEQANWILLAAVALLPLTLPELGSLGTLVTGKKETAGDYVLVPLVDSMNHVTTAKTDLSFSPVSGELGVSVERGYREGEQAFISYGLKSNDELLQFYGFVEADCPADTYVVDGDVATALDIPKERIPSMMDAITRAVMDGVVIRRGPEVVSKETLKGLRVLLDAGAGAGDAVVWQALRSACEVELASVKPSADAVEAEGGSVRERLALAFRREKASVLEEAIRNLGKLAA